MVVTRPSDRKDRTRRKTGLQKINSYSWGHTCDYAENFVGKSSLLGDKARQHLKYAVIIARVLLGLVFRCLQVQRLPALHSGAHARPGRRPLERSVLSVATFIIAVLRVVGLLLLIRRFVPLGLTLLGPVIVNIMLYHIFLDTSGLPMAIVISILALFLLWGYRDRFPAIFQP